MQTVDCIVGAREIIRGLLRSISPGYKRRAYICPGCGGIYWQDGVDCDCNYFRGHKVPKLRKVTVVSESPFIARTK